jgi:peptidoglycan biosynthesis protein MviN/MurJ (putative lipid II flippase)
MGEAMPGPAGTNKTAVAALVAGFAAWFALAALFIEVAANHGQTNHDLLKIITAVAFWSVPVSAVLGVVLGHVARAQTQGPVDSGRQLALWALVLCYLAVLTFLGLIALTVLAVQAFMHLV